MIQNSNYINSNQFEVINCNDSLQQTRLTKNICLKIKSNYNFYNQLMFFFLLLISPFFWTKNQNKQRKNDKIKYKSYRFSFDIFYVFMIAVSLIATAILPTQQLLGMQFYFTILNVFLWSHGHFFVETYSINLFLLFLLFEFML